MDVAVMCYVDVSQPLPFTKRLALYSLLELPHNSEGAVHRVGIRLGALRGQRRASAGRFQDFGRSHLL